MDIDIGDYNKTDLDKFRMQNYARAKRKVLLFRFLAELLFRFLADFTCEKWFSEI